MTIWFLLAHPVPVFISLPENIFFKIVHLGKGYPGTLNEFNWSALKNKPDKPIIFAAWQKI